MMTSRILRPANRRAVMLVAVWALSGIWGVGHAIAHEVEHEHAAHHAESAVQSSSGDVAVAVEEDLDHGHPDSSPIVASGKRPEFASTALLAATPELPLQVPVRLFAYRTAPARAGPAHQSAFGPRAPPVS